MRDKKMIGPFMRLILTQLAQRCDERLQAAQDSEARGRNCVRMLRLLAVVQTVIESEDQHETEGTSRCFRLRCGGS